MANFDKLREMAKADEHNPKDLALFLAVCDQLEHFVGLIERIATALEVQAETRPREDA